MSSTKTKPSIIVIPGSFTPLAFWAPIIVDLEAHGYDAHGIELETVGRRDKAPGLYDDAAKVAALASRLADEGKDVVLVPHSYGGIVACEASKGLAKSVREREGKPGGIVRIIFLTSVVGLEGQSVKDMFADGELDFFRIEAGYMVMDAARSAAVAFSDLSPEEGLAWASKMPDHSAISFTQPLTYGAYKDVAVSYLFCEDDKLVTPEVQNKIIAAMESEMGFGRKVERYPVRSDHAINASHPKTVVEVVRRALEDVE